MSVITKPFAWLLLQLYYLTSNYGLAVILFALLVKLVLLPFQMKSTRSMMRLSRFTPRMKELEKKYEGNKQKYQEELAKLYKAEGVNPMSGCLWTLLPFPILIALYSVIRQPLTRMMGLAAEQVTQITDALTSMGLYAGETTAYSEITISQLVHENYEAISAIVPEVVDLNYNFLGLNLGSTPSFAVWSFDWSTPSAWLPAVGLFLIPIISAFFSWLAMRISNRSNPQTAEQQGNMKTMMIISPLISLWICFSMPAALGVYWIFNSVFGIIQDLILNRHYNKVLDAEDAVRIQQEKEKEAELEAKRQETERLRAEGATVRNPNTSKRKIQSNQKAREEERQAAIERQERQERRERLGISTGKEEQPASQVGNRRYARGRAYVPDRFTNPEAAQKVAEAAAEDASEDISAGAPEADTLQAAEGAALEAAAAEPEAPSAPAQDAAAEVEEANAPTDTAGEDEAPPAETR